MARTPRTATRPLAPQSRGLDEIFVQNEAVALCLLVNRRAQTMRVVDFRAGPSVAKRRVVLSVAEREGVAKVFTLVERDELQTWVKLGFAKEGTLPAFYKRSDAFLLGCRVAAGDDGAGEGMARGLEGEGPAFESETRIVAAAAAPPVGADGGSVAASASTAKASRAQAKQSAAERTLAAAKRLANDFRGRPLPALRAAPISEAEARKALAAAMRKGRALTGFEPFGRDVQRRYLALAGRAGFDLVASIESQPCFGNALLELVQGPRGAGSAMEGELAGTLAALRELCAVLTDEGTLCAFALTPSDDVALAAAFLHSGFRRTGLLADQLVVGGAEGSRKDAIVWSRKLAGADD